MEDHVIEFYDNCIQALELYTEYAGTVFDSLSTHSQTTSDFLIKRCHQIQKEETTETEKALSIVFLRDALLGDNFIFEKLFYKSGLISSFESVLQLVEGCYEWEDMEVLFDTVEGSRFYIKVLLLMFTEILSRNNTKVVSVYMQMKDSGVPFHLIEKDPQLFKPYFIDESKKKDLGNSKASEYSQIKSSKKPDKHNEPVQKTIIPQPQKQSDMKQVVNDIASRRTSIYNVLKAQTTYKEIESDKIVATNKEILDLLNQYPDTFSMYMVLHIELTDKIEIKMKEINKDTKRYNVVREELLELIEKTEKDIANENGGNKLKQPELYNDFIMNDNKSNNNTLELYDNIQYDDKPLLEDLQPPFIEEKLPQKKLSIISEIESSINETETNQYYNFDNNTRNNYINTPIKQPVALYHNENIPNKQPVVLYHNENTPNNPQYGNYDQSSNRKMPIEQKDGSLYDADITPDEIQYVNYDQTHGRRAPIQQKEDLYDNDITPEEIYFYHTEKPKNPNGINKKIDVVDERLDIGLKSNNEPQVQSFKEYFKNNNELNHGHVKSSIRDKLCRAWEKPKSNILLTVHKYEKGNPDKQLKQLEIENQKLKEELTSALVAKQSTLEELKAENKKLMEKMKLNEIEYVQKVLYMEKTATETKSKSESIKNNKVTKVDQGVSIKNHLPEVAEELKAANDNMLLMIHDLQSENVNS